MPKYNVSCDIALPVVLEIEADSEEAALDKLFEMDRKELLRLANTEPSGISILEGSEDISPGAP